MPTRGSVGLVSPISCSLHLDQHPPFWPMAPGLCVSNPLGPTKPPLALNQPHASTLLAPLPSFPSHRPSWRPLCVRVLRVCLCSLPPSPPSLPAVGVRVAQGDDGKHAKGHGERHELEVGPVGGHAVAVRALHHRLLHLDRARQRGTGRHTRQSDTLKHRLRGRSRDTCICQHLLLET